MKEGVIGGGEMEEGMGEMEGGRGGRRGRRDVTRGKEEEGIKKKVREGDEKKKIMKI